jgi:hypothetical protein
LSIDRAQGLSVASPAPTPTRAMNNSGNVIATPHIIVIRLQNTMPAKSRLRRLPRSANEAINTPKNV